MELLAVLITAAAKQTISAMRIDAKIRVIVELTSLRQVHAGSKRGCICLCQSVLKIFKDDSAIKLN